MHSGYRELAAYRLSSELGDELWETVARWSQFERWSLGLQLVRSVDSVSANVAEAYGRWQPRDKARLLVTARGSLCEADHWLRRAARRGLIDEVPDARLDEVARSLSGLINAQRRR